MMRIANFFGRWVPAFRRLKTASFAIIPLRVFHIADDWGLVKQFTVASFIIILLGMIGIGKWVGEKIKIGVIKEATSATALYMDSFIAPNLQELGRSDTITPEHIRTLNNLFSKTDLGSRTVSVKIWGKDDQILYSNIPALVGRTFPDSTDLASSWNGGITGDISDLQEDENVEERRLSSDPLFQIYSPVRLNATNQIIAVAEFYQKVDTLEAEIAKAQRRGWLVVGATMATIYLLLVGFVQWAGNRLGQQDLELKNQVAQLTQLLSHNKELAKRVRLAAANTAAINESLLRRISAELHDGPVQEISLALLRLDQAIGQNEACRLVKMNAKCNNLPVVQTSLQLSLQGMRAIAARFGLPRLDGFTLPEVFIHVVRAHEQRTNTNVTLNMSGLPKQTTLSIKIAVYRFIQEGLNNAYRHADSKGQEVQVTCNSNRMIIEIVDQGPGLDINLPHEWDEHLGLAGMRDRIESLGGLFSITSQIGQGAKLTAMLSLQDIGDTVNG